MGGNETGCANGRDGGTSCSTTGEKWTGTKERKPETFGDIMLRPSSCSGSTMAEKVSK